MCLRKDGPCSGTQMVALWRSASGLVIQQGPICEAHILRTPGLRGAVLVPGRVPDEEAERLVSLAEGGPGPSQA